MAEKTGKLFKGRSGHRVGWTRPNLFGLQTPEETIARDFLTQNRPDLTVNIVDVNDLNEICSDPVTGSLGILILIALNMMDELARRDRDSERLKVLLEISPFPA